MKELIPIPLEKMTEKDVDRFWSQVAIRARQDVCWEWKGYKIKYGYGRIRCYRTRVLSHRLAFFLAGKQITNEKPHVLHSCDNPSCCNPSHLFAGSPADNCLDKEKKGRANHAKGEAGGVAKLSASKVAEIRALCDSGGMSYRKIAPLFNVTGRTIGCISRRVSWTHVPEQNPGAVRSARIKNMSFLPGEEHLNAKLSASDVIQIRQLSEEGMEQKEIARLFGLSRRNVNGIVRRETWTHIPEAER